MKIKLLLATSFSLFFSCAMTSYVKSAVGGIAANELILESWAPQERQSFMDGFRQKNPQAEIKEIQTDDQFGVLSYFRMQPPEKSDKQDPLKTVQSFVQANLDFLGLDSDDIKSVKYGLMTLGRPMVTVKSELIPYQGFSDEDFRGGYKVDLRFSMSADGHILSLHNGSRKVPGISKLESYVANQPDMATVRKKIEGLDLKYHNFAGQEVSAGKFGSSAELSGPWKVLYQQRLDQGRMRILVVWAVRVHHQDRSWTCFLDSEDLRVVELVPDFFS